MTSQSKTIPSLYGIRAISILLVVVSHCFLRTRGEGRAEKILLALAGNGTVGVSIFFVVSGFLITLLLLKERSHAGSVDLRDFYLRRVFRILPAFLIYIAVIAVLTLAGSLSVPWQQFWRALTFTMDYVPEKNWFLGHVWSLSVEEQFYLLWPLLLVLCSRRLLTVITGGIIVLGPLIRMLDRVVLPGTRSEIEYMGHTRLDMLMFGCLIALYFEEDWLRALLAKTNALAVPALSAVFLFLISPLIEMRFGGVYIKTFGYSLQGMTISFMMLYLITRPESLPGKVFNSRLVVHLGAISYSLYLWQELFIGFREFSVTITAIRVAAAFLLAEISYYFVEAPMLRMKRRVAGAQSAVLRFGRSISEQTLADS